MDLHDELVQVVPKIEASGGQGGPHSQQEKPMELQEYLILPGEYDLLFSLLMSRRPQQK